MKRIILPQSVTMLPAACCNTPEHTEQPSVVCEVQQIVPNGPAVLVELQGEQSRHDNGEFVTITYRGTVRASIGSTLTCGESILVDTFELSYKDWMIIHTDARYITRETDGTVRLNATDFNFTKPTNVRDYPAPLPAPWEQARRILKTN